MEAVAARMAGTVKTTDREQLVETLTRIRHEVQKWSWLGGYPREEVTLLIDEARIEAGREHLNRFRLYALGQALNALSETNTALGAVYKAFKEALAPFGVILP